MKVIPEFGYNCNHVEGKSNDFEEFIDETFVRISKHEEEHITRG